VSSEGLVKISDLCFSKSMDDDTGLTAAGTTVGSPFYISPEQAKGSKEIDGRADIYSLGCTVYHMLTGSPPFLAESMPDIMHKHIKAPRPDPREMLPEISEASSLLVKKMMAVHPNERPDTAEMLVREIDELITKLPEPENMERPLPRIEQSGSVKEKGATQRNIPVNSRSQRIPPQQPVAKEPDLPKPSGLRLAWSRFVDWLSNLFG
jgi:serine/threonine-protein kinase